MRCFASIGLSFFILFSFGQEKRGTIKIVKTPADTVAFFYSDTIRINNTTFKIVLPAEYKSKLYPKIANGRFILVDKNGLVSDIDITSYILNIMQNGAVSEYYTHNLLHVPMLNAISKKQNFKGSIIIHSFMGESPGGVTLKNIIDYFYLEKIR